MEIESSPSVFNDQLQQLLQKEKVARQNDQFLETGRILIQIVTLCWDNKDINILQEQLLSLSKKRGQPKKAQIDMVQLVMTYLSQISDLSQKSSLISTLKTMSEKKIYLEVEYARLCLASVKLMENQENIDEAARIMQEVQVETYGSMDKREKLEFILYQMKIMIKKQDYVRLYIISKKINQKSIISEKGFEDLRILYNSYLVIYYMQEHLYLEASGCYQNIFDCLSSDKELEAKMQESEEIKQFNILVGLQSSFENYVCLLLISSYTNDKEQAIERLKDSYSRTLLNYNHLDNIVNAYTGNELVLPQTSHYALDQVQVMSSQYSNSSIHRDCLFKQLVQKDLRVIQMYYCQISLVRISELLQTNIEICEQELCTLINQQIVIGRIDRVEGSVSFNKKQNENQILGEWQQDVHSVLDIIDRTCKLIQRENDMQKVN